MKNHYDIIVIGGGAVGATTAWRLAQSGLSVLLLDRGRLGGEASSAAAGMLGAQLEADQPGPFYRLCLQSRDLYPAFAEELLEETGIDIQWTKNGILQVAPDEARARELQARAAWQTAAGGSAEWWTPEDIAEREPAVHPGLGGVFLPEDGNVSAANLAQAVGMAAKRRADVREGAYVTHVEAVGMGVRVTTPEATYEASGAVIAAGAWADALLRHLGNGYGVRPVKGQLFAIRPRDGSRLVRTVSAPGIYLVPKRDGTIIAGATEEHGAGFDRDVTAAGLLQLLEALARTAPGLAEARFERAWTGLRPRGTGGHPVIGPLPDHPQILLAVGHFRNGILLSPLTARIVTDWVHGRPLPDDWRAFAPQAAGGQVASAALGARGANNWSAK